MIICLSGEKVRNHGVHRLSILMLNMFIAMLGIGLIIPIMPTYITEFGATGSTMGLLVAAAGLHSFYLRLLPGK